MLTVYSSEANDQGGYESFSDMPLSSARGSHYFVRFNRNDPGSQEWHA